MKLSHEFMAKIQNVKISFRKSFRLYINTECYQLINNIGVEP